MAPSALLEDAAVGRLPTWASVGRRRLAHMRRVADLMGDWVVELQLPPDEQMRWRAAGYLHDALRDANPEELRSMVPDGMKHLADGLLHGPAAAEQLRLDGVHDESLLRAIAFHTIGHPDLDELGRALFIADYIESGRPFEPARLAVLRARMPSSRDEVLRDVLGWRMERLLRQGQPLPAETAAFWNQIHGAPARVGDVEA
jgi:nicotinate-nucleotide adenylyltransferase